MVRFVPKVAHFTGPGVQSWLGSWHLIHEHTRSALATSNGWTHEFWTDERGRDCISEHFQYILSLFDASARIEQSDMIRLCALWRDGGVYIDLDLEVLSDFHAHLSLSDTVYVLESPYKDQTIQNSLIASPARHPFWEACFREMHRFANSVPLRSCGTGDSEASRECKMRYTAAFTGQNLLARMAALSTRLPGGRIVFTNQSWRVQPLPCNRFFPPVLRGIDHKAWCGKPIMHATPEKARSRGVLSVHWDTYACWASEPRRSSAERSTHCVPRACHFLLGRRGRARVPAGNGGGSSRVGCCTSFTASHLPGSANHPRPAKRRYTPSTATAALRVCRGCRSTLHAPHA